MEQMGIPVKMIHAGHANMFLSSIFRDTLAGVTGLQSSFMTRMALSVLPKVQVSVQVSTRIIMRLLQHLKS